MGLVTGILVCEAFGPILGWAKETPTQGISSGFTTRVGDRAHKFVSKDLHHFCMYIFELSRLPPGSRVRFLVGLVFEYHTIPVFLNIGSARHSLQVMARQMTYSTDVCHAKL